LILLLPERGKRNWLGTPESALKFSSQEVASLVFWFFLTSSLKAKDDDSVLFWMDREFHIG
jgi:hypothetical protein